MKKKENDEIRITPDALISLVVTEAEERELASMPSLKEMNAQFHPSEQFQKKMDRLLKKAHRKEGWVQIWKPTKKVLIAFTSVVTALTFALLPVQAFQDAVVDTLIQWRDGFMNIVYSQETDRQHFDIASKINLSCILTGFTLTDEETSNQDRYIAEFTSDSGGWYSSIGPSGLQFLHRIRDGLLHSIGGLLRLPAHAGLPRQHQRYRAACGHAEAERQQKGSYLHRSSSLHAFLHG